MGKIEMVSSTRCLAMDEQRVQAYLWLIKQLLDFPSREEPQILNQSSEWVDEGFVQVCGVLAEQLQGEA